MSRIMEVFTNRAKISVARVRPVADEPDHMIAVAFSFGKPETRFTIRLTDDEARTLADEMLTLVQP